MERERSQALVRNSADPFILFFCLSSLGRSPALPHCNASLTSTLLFCSAMSHDKAASLPKATDFLPSPSEAPSAPARPTLYSIAVSLSGPPPPRPPSLSHPLHSSQQSPTPVPSILEPQHFPSLAGGREAGEVSGVEGGRNACEVRGGSGPQHETQDSKSCSPKLEDAQDDASGSGRVGPIQVEWLDFDNAQGSNDMARQASSSSSTPHPPNLTPISLSVPSTGLLSLPAGSIHLYRHGPTGSANPKSDVPSSLSIFTTAEVKMESSSPAGNSIPSLLAVSQPPFSAWLQSQRFEIY